MRKWILSLLAVTIAVFVVAVATGTFPQYWHAWGMWRTGTSPGQERLGGWSVMMWGRLGKIMQFAAGLVAVFDFIDIDKVRAFGQRARGRYESRRAARKAARIAATANLLIHRLQGVVIKGPAAELPPGANVPYEVASGMARPIGWWIRKNPRFWIPSRVISRHEVRQFREDVLRRIDRDIRHSQGKPYIASDEKVLELARALVDAKVGGYDAEVGERLEGRLDNVMFRIGQVVGIPVLFCCVVLMGAGLLETFGVPLPGLARLELFMFLAFVAGFGFLAVAGLIAPRTLVVIQLLWDGAVAVMVRAVVVTFDKGHPDRAFRIIALYLFVAGFHFDLLAS